jgi:NADH:ubiquinone oxidoreductase subunit 5 (subunit L)/multisubunit Na+/H+ antiporter MnhA subunit
MSMMPELLMLTLVIGALTALYGGLTMLVQTDIKRSLAYSTVGQMGFMMMQCGLGAFSAAIVHLIAHSLFKASLFLGSGGVIQQNPGTELRKLDSKPSMSPLAALEILMLVLVSAYGLSHLATLFGAQSDLGLQGAPSLLVVFPALASGQAFYLGLQPGRVHADARTHSGHWALFSFPLVLLFCYAVFENGFHRFLAESLPAISTRPSPLAFILVILLIALTLGMSWFRQSLPTRWRDRLYVWLWSQGLTPSNLQTMTRRFSSTKTAGV